MKWLWEKALSELKTINIGMADSILQIIQIMVIFILVYIGVCSMFDFRKEDCLKIGYFTLSVYVVIRLFYQVVIGI